MPRSIFVLALLLAPACFDVTKVPVPAFVVDDFEDANALRPRAERFGDWMCRTFTTPLADGGPSDGPDAGAGADGGAPAARCVVEAFGDHPRAMTMTFELTDPSDGTRQLGGAELATETVGMNRVDFGSFKELVLSAILEGDQGLPSGTQLRVEIGCTPSAMPIKIEQIVPGLVIGTDWKTFQLDLAAFAPSQPACLHQVDALRISVRPGLPDGVSTRGALHVDNISLR